MEKEKKRKGDIVWVDLGEHPGTRIQSGRKLCLIVSTDKGNGSVGDKVTVTYTGTVSEVDPFMGEVLSVTEAK